MSNAIVKRMEKLLANPCPKPKQSTEHTGGVTTCTRLRRLQQMQSELITLGSLLDNHANQDSQVEDDLDPTVLDNDPVSKISSIKELIQRANKSGSIRELIAARIAQTEETDGTSAEHETGSANDINRTIINLNSWSASIYFWSPYTSWINEKRKAKLMPNKLQGRSSILSNDIEDNNTHRNKDAFVNFSKPALILVARNEQTPCHTLKWLAAHHSAEVRQAVAQNENIDEETLVLLSQDHSDSVRSAVLDNAKINKELAIKLANDRSLGISTKARNIYYKLDMQSKKPTDLTNQKNTENGSEILKYERDFLKTVADSADPSQRIIVKSPRSADWHIRMLVAGDPNSTAEILWQLAAHPISQVKRKLVDKYSCLLETMVNLTGHNKPDTNNSLAASATETIN